MGCSPRGSRRLRQASQGKEEERDIGEPHSIDRRRDSFLVAVTDDWSNQLPHTPLRGRQGDESAAVTGRDPNQQTTYSFSCTFSRPEVTPKRVSELNERSAGELISAYESYPSHVINDCGRLWR